jgi:hypothetical protein
MTILVRIRGLAGLAALAVCAALVAGCATRPVADNAAASAPAAGSVLRALATDRAVEDRILALDPERISEADVSDTLAKGPAPQIILLHGGIYPVYLAMTSFGRFLVRMGYPESRIRDRRDRRWSHSPNEDSAHLAGLVAWYYEHDGMPPMLIGHSQGGIQAIKVLRELDGQFAGEVAVYSPLTDAPEARTSIVDPLTGKPQPVVGLKVDYVSVIAAGGAALLLPNQWSMAGRLRTIPNSVEHFTGYSIGLDLWAWTVPGVPASSEFRHNGSAEVRNVTLPAWYNHVTAPTVHDLPEDPAVRAWISAYAPGKEAGPVPLEDSGRSVLWAADVWYSVKKYWCLEAQRLIRARRAATS